MKLGTLERDLYIEERKAERGVYWRQRREELKKAPILEKPPIFMRHVVHCAWIIVMFGYWTLADYGRSFARPLAWSFVSVFIIYLGHALILAPLKQKVDPANKDYFDQAVWMLALGNAVPFVGHLSIDAGIKKSLYCPGDVCGERSPISPLGVQVLVIVQNVASIALIFSSASRCAIISRSSDGPKRPDFPNAKQGRVARRKAAARSECAPPVTSTPGRAK